MLRTALPASSDPAVPPRFLHGDGTELDAPREWELARLVLPGIAPSDWERASVEVQGRSMPLRLERIGGAPQVCAMWDRVGAGTWQVRVRVDGTTSDHLVPVAPAKLTGEQLSALIVDLEERLPASVAVSLDRLGAFAGLHWTPPAAATLAQELEQVRRALDGGNGMTGLTTVLHEVARHPHQVLAHEQRWVRVETARRPVPVRLAAALARPGNLLSAEVPAFVVDGRVAVSFDTYENRLLREFAFQADRRLRTLERAAARQPTFEAAHGSTLRRLRGTLRAARHAAGFLDGVGALRTAPDRLTQVLLRRPTYRAALEVFIRFRRSAHIRLDHPAMDAPLQDVPTLYELWGTLVVLTELLALADIEGWQVASQRLIRPGAVDPLVTVLGAGVLLDLRKGGFRATLHVQRSFTRTGADLHSISFEQRPDLVLEVQGDAGRRALHLFDPKYKLSGAELKGVPVKADIDKMHAYRDAIRDGDGLRVVRSAAVLYPGPDCLFGDGIGAFSALPSEVPATLRANLRAALSGVSLEQASHTENVE